MTDSEDRELIEIWAKDERIERARAEVKQDPHAPTWKQRLARLPLSTEGDDVDPQEVRPGQA